MIPPSTPSNSTSLEAVTVQKRHTIDVFGVCVSIAWFYAAFMQEQVKRDNKVIISFFCERQSLKSAITPAIPIDLKSFPIVPNAQPMTDALVAAQTRMTNVALNKSFFANLEKGRASEYLIIDCCGERFDFFEIGEVFVDYTTPTVRAFLIKQEPKLQPKSPFDYIRDNPIKAEQHVAKFCEKIKQYYRVDKIIINKVFYATKARYPDGRIESLEPSLVHTYSRANTLLAWYYERLERNLKGCLAIESPAEVFCLPKIRPEYVIDGVHFVDSWHKNFYQKIIEKVENDEKSEIMDKQRLLTENGILRNEHESLCRKMSLAESKLTALQERALLAESELASLREKSLLAESTVTSLRKELANTKTELFSALAKVHRYHQMSKDSVISIYRKIRRTLGKWHYS